LWVQGDLTELNEQFHYELHKEIYCISSHVHFTVEICIMLEGETEITINDKKETAKSGQGILILPFQEHSYHSESECVFAIYTFSPAFIAEFVKKNEGKVGESAVFDLSELTRTVFRTRLIEEKNFSLYNIKACLYFIISEYTAQVNMVNGIPDGGVIDKLMYYLNKNYSSRCSLSETAAAIGYNEKYISTCIQKHLHSNYCSLLNSIRVMHARYLLTETDNSVTDIALLCGFNDIRSLQRNFKKFQGISPTEYRERKRENPQIQPTSHIFPKSYFGE